MAILFDAASNSGYQTTSSYSWSHTTSGLDRLVRVAVSMLSVAGSSISGITHDGVSLTKLRHDVSASGTVRTEIWYLIAPSVGTKTIAVTLSTALDSVAGAVSFTGVDQTNPIDAQNGGTGVTTEATLNITTVNDTVLVTDVIATTDTAITVGSGQTERYNISGALGSGAGSTEPKTPAGSITMNWGNVGAPDVWTMSVMSINSSVTADRWLPNTNQPIEKTNSIKRLQYLYPSLSWPNRILQTPMVISGPYAHIIFEQVFQYQSYTKPLVPILKPMTISGPYVHIIFPQVMQYQSYAKPLVPIINPTTISGPFVNVIFEQVFQYKSFVEPLENELRIPEKIRIDKWIGSRPDYIWDKEHREFSYPSFFIDPTQLTQGERVDLDKWIGSKPDYIWDKKHFEFTYPSLFIDTQALTQSERIDLDKWYMRLSEPRWDVKRWQWLYPTRDDRTELFIPTEAPIDALFHQPDYIYPPKFRPYYYPSLSIDASLLTQPERIDVDKWYVELQRPPKGPKHWEYLYPYLAIDAEQLTQLERLTMDKWFKELERPPIRYKATPHLYPYLWWYPRILLAPMVISGVNTHVIFSQLFQYQKWAFNPYPLENAYSLPSKRNATDFTIRTKNTTDFSTLSKNTTDFSTPAKNTTDFSTPTKLTGAWTKQTKTGTDWTDP